MPSPQDKRDKALQRALKFATLFQEESFDKILSSVSPTGAPPQSFIDACKQGDITQPEDQNWLWNYLKHMNEEIPGEQDPTKKKYWQVAHEADKINKPEFAAATGW